MPMPKPEIIYQDQYIAVINKPSGLLTIPSPKNEKYTLTFIINEMLKKEPSSANLYPCHRLDRETSGLIIYARGKAIQQKMREEFKQKNEDHFEISVREKPERNLANTRILTLLADHFHLPVNKVRIINGHQSPSKLLVVEN